MFYSMYIFEYTKPSFDVQVVLNEGIYAYKLCPLIDNSNS